MRYSIPAKVTYRGFVEIEATCLEDAELQADVMNEEGVDLLNMKDVETHSTLMVNEIEICL